MLLGTRRPDDDRLEAENLSDQRHDAKEHHAQGYAIASKVSEFVLSETIRYLLCNLFLGCDVAI